MHKPWGTCVQHLAFLRNVIRWRCWQIEIPQYTSMQLQGRNVTGIMLLRNIIVFLSPSSRLSYLLKIQQPYSEPKLASLSIILNIPWSEYTFDLTKIYATTSQKCYWNNALERYHSILKPIFTIFYPLKRFCNLSMNPTWLHLSIIVNIPWLLI